MESEILKLSINSVRSQRPYAAIDLQFTAVPPKTEDGKWQVIPSDGGKLYERKTKSAAILAMAADRLEVD